MEDVSIGELESLLLHGNFEETAKRCDLIVVEGAAFDGYQRTRLLAVLVQSYCCSGRLEDVPAAMKKVGGVQKVPFAPFLYWMLLLVEHRQCLQAKQYIEEYMPSLLNYDSVQEQDQAQEGYSETESSMTDLMERSKQIYALAALYAVEILARCCKDVGAAVNWLQEAYYLPDEAKQSLYQAVRKVQEDPSFREAQTQAKDQTSLTSINEIQPSDSPSAADVSSSPSIRRHQSGSIRRRSQHHNTPPSDITTTSTTNGPISPGRIPRDALPSPNHLQLWLMRAQALSAQAMSHVMSHASHVRDDVMSHVGRLGRVGLQRCLALGRSIAVAVQEVGLSQVDLGGIIAGVAIVAALLAERRLLGMLVGQWRRLVGRRLSQMRQALVNNIWGTLMMGVTLAPRV